jgi:hypothetical protein
MFLNEKQHTISSSSLGIIQMSALIQKIEPMPQICLRIGRLKIREAKRDTDQRDV